jgi:hypothetical protein
MTLIFIKCGLSHQFVSGYTKNCSTSHHFSFFQIFTQSLWTSTNRGGSNSVDEVAPRVAEVQWFQPFSFIQLIIWCIFWNLASWNNMCDGSICEFPFPFNSGNLLQDLRVYLGPSVYALSLIVICEHLLSQWRGLRASRDYSISAISSLLWKFPDTTHTGSLMEVTTRYRESSQSKSNRQKSQKKKKKTVSSCFFKGQSEITISISRSRLCFVAFNMMPLHLKI